MKTLAVRFRMIAIAIAGYFVLLLPLIFNGAPIYWPDSIAYLHGGSTALSVAANIETRYKDIERVPAESQTDTAATNALPHAATLEKTAAQEEIVAEPVEYRISTARSPYYAVFLTAFSSVAGLYAPVFVQALIILVTLGFLIKAVFPEYPEIPAILILGATALTSAGVFSAVLLPDFLAPLGLLAAIMLFAFWQSLKPLEKCFWYFVLVASIVSHSSHLALILFLLPFAILFSVIILKRLNLAASCVVASALCIGVISNAFFSTLVERHYGYKPLPFPMIAASIIMDGAGRDYLEATCPENGYVYCDYLEAKATRSDLYLWSTEHGVGVYSLVDRETRDRMSTEQWDFLIDTLRYDFIGQTQASVGRMYRQAVDNSLIQFIYSDAIKDQLGTLPADDRGPIENSAIFNDRFPVVEISRGSEWVGWAALTVLVTILGRALITPVDIGASHNAEKRKSLIFLSLLVLIGFLINAGLTGAASQPQGRYSARIFMLFPILLSVWVAFILRSTDRYAFRAA